MSMLVCLNGRFVPAADATVSVFDRGFLYGDGLFESIRAWRGRLFLPDAHMERLTLGARMLDLALPAEPERLLQLSVELLRRNDLQDAVVRINLSRGPGPRGYSVRGADTPTWVISTHPAPPLGSPPPGPWRLHTASFRLAAGHPVSAFKSSSRLLSVLARAEAERSGTDEALFLDTAGRIVETVAANVFWFDGDRCCTPSIAVGCLPGVTRGFVLQLLAQMGWNPAEVFSEPGELLASRGAFLTVSSAGLIEVESLDGQRLNRDPRIDELRKCFESVAAGAVSD